MAITDEINLAALNIWERKFTKTDDVYMPQVYGKIHKHSLLFIGLNPSFSTNGFRQIFRNTKFAALNPNDFFHWRNKANYSIETAKEIEQLAREKYPHYRKFKELSLEISLEWECIDLFFYRETKQNLFKPKIYFQNRLNDFGKQQIDLSKRLVNEVEPKIIVVANAFASDLFIKEFGSKYDEKLGYHFTKINNGEIIPTFLASMFTGQRAMDVYSYQRLRWQIKNAA
jgi:hypothetical protein